MHNANQASPQPTGLAIKLRPYEPADLETLYRIDQRCFPPGISYTFEELAFFVRQPSGRTWVAEADGEIAGFITVMRRSARASHIITIDVVEGFRRRGVGRTLMDAAESWARKARTEVMVLETAVDNLAAQQFYKARGYRKVDRLENYYSDGTAAWRMVKRLPGC